MFEQFIEKLKNEGKSSLTIRQYRSSWSRFTGWLQQQEGYTRGAGGDWCQGNGSESDIQNFKTSTANLYNLTKTMYEPNIPSVSGKPKTLANGIDATQLDIAEFKRWASQNYKPRTVSLNLIHLKAIFRYFVDQGYIPDNPVQHVENVTVQQTAPKWLDRKEQNSLVRAVRNYGDFHELTITTLLLHTGLRVQEICDLRLKDVIISERKGTLIVQQGKGGKYREVPLNVDARRAVEDYIVNGRKNGSEYLFTTQRSPKMTPRAVQHILAKYAKLTGLEVSPHCLRHTFGHELAVRKVPLDVIARLMGHIRKDGSPNLDMVTRYTTPGRADLERAVEELSWT